MLKVVSCDSELLKKAAMFCCCASGKTVSKSMASSSFVVSAGTALVIGEESCSNCSGSISVAFLFFCGIDSKDTSSPSHLLYKLDWAAVAFKLASHEVRGTIGVNGSINGRVSGLEPRLAALTRVVPISVLCSLLAKGPS